MLLRTRFRYPGFQACTQNRGKRTRAHYKDKQVREILLSSISLLGLQTRSHGASRFLDIAVGPSCCWSRSREVRSVTHDTVNSDKPCDPIGIWRVRWAGKEYGGRQGIGLEIEQGERSGKIVMPDAHSQSQHNAEHMSPTSGQFISHRANIDNTNLYFPIPQQDALRRPPS